jgi:hypothetical protein
MCDETCSSAVKTLTLSSDTLEQSFADFVLHNRHASAWRRRQREMFCIHTFTKIRKFNSRPGSIPSPTRRLGSVQFRRFVPLSSLSMSSPHILSYCFATYSQSLLSSSTICYFNDAINVSVYMTSNGWVLMNNKLKVIWKETLVV